jgi:hypothetical protein
MLSPKIRIKDTHSLGIKLNTEMPAAGTKKTLTNTNDPTVMDENPLLKIVIKLKQ